MNAEEADLLVAWATLSSLVLGVLLMFITGDQMYILLSWVVRILMGFLIPRQDGRTPRKYPSLRLRLWGLARSFSLVAALVAVIWWTVEMAEIVLHPHSALVMAGIVLLVMATWFLPGLAEEEFNGLGGAKSALVVILMLGVVAKALDIIEPFEMLKSFVLSEMMVMIPVVLLFISPVIVQLLLFADPDKQKRQLDPVEEEEEREEAWEQQKRHSLCEDDENDDGEIDYTISTDSTEDEDDDINMLEQISKDKNLKEEFKLLKEMKINGRLSGASLSAKRRRVFSAVY